MSLLNLLQHFFLPHKSNNQKAKLLHSESLAVLILFIIGFQFLLNFSGKVFPSVLGYAANISPSEVISLTNNQRVANGLSPLTENKTLDSAALAKGNDMLAKGYWAHFAPDGTSPWSFFASFGYKYQYAGENLARDFTNADSAVTAWMNSPSHKENILNPRYKEVGIGVVQGALSGSDTTIIVQFFGAPVTDKPSIPIAKAEDVKKIAQTVQVTPSPIPVQPTSTPNAAIVSSVAKVSPFQSTKSLSVGIIGILLLVLSVDLIIVKRKRISRIGGRTLAHIAYLSMILAVILLLKAGQII